MRKRAMLSAGLVGVALLSLGCRKNDESTQPAPEASAGAKDTTAAAANPAPDTTAAATGAYGDSAAAKTDTTMGATSDTVAAPSPSVPADTSAGATSDSTR